jgi:predicted NAD/FAD-dependent oxidoreductase
MNEYADAILKASEEASWDWGNMYASHHSVIAVAVLRAAAKQLREAYVNEVYFEPADDWLDSIADELENCQ